jgi:CheY-like chemotaxis protein
MRPRKILLADDETYVTSLVAGKLRQLGDEVHIACDGDEAFALACELLPDLVVTDFQMPVKSGFELACSLRENESTRETPLVMLTARGHLLSASELARTNIRQLLAKPFSAKELIAIIAELIGNPGCGGIDGAIAV